MTDALSAPFIAHYLGDDAALPGGIRAALEAAGIRLMGAADLSALSQLVASSPAGALIVSLIALPLPTRNLPELRRLYGRRRLVIIVLTPEDRAADHPGLLYAGADDALPASAEPQVLVGRLTTALRTVEQFVVPASWPRGVLRTPDTTIAVDVRAQRCLVREGGTYREVLLTRKQLLALTTLLRAAGRPVAWEQFFSKGWRPGKLRRRSRTLVQHVLALRRKLGPAGLCIKAVPGTGYRLTV